MADFRLSELERQLLRLALCRSAQGGEITTSAMKLIKSWRDRGVESNSIETAFEGSGAEPPVQLSKPDHGLNVMPFGQHKGEMFMNIPPSDLHSTFRWINEAPARARKFKDLADAIDQFLNLGA
jgi:hypothetical protein